MILPPLPRMIFPPLPRCKHFSFHQSTLFFGKLNMFSFLNCTFIVFVKEKNICKHSFLFCLKKKYLRIHCHPFVYARLAYAIVLYNFWSVIMFYFLNCIYCFGKEKNIYKHSLFSYLAVTIHCCSLVYQ